MTHYIGKDPHKGEEKLVVALDVGATQTGVSFVHLCTGALPEVRMVNRWPGQAAARGDSKIPTIVAYQRGYAKAFGIQAEEYKDTDGYEIAKWFKLHLHPNHMRLSDSDQTPRTNSSTMEMPPLPQNVTLKKVYTDFLRYLYTITRQLFEDEVLNGRNVWDRLRSNNFVLVVAVPNGWDLPQQEFLRTAAIEAGWIAQGCSDKSITFVTEGEASVHYALTHQHDTAITSGAQFMIVDAGGSTVDSTFYECVDTWPKLQLKEVYGSECVQAGGIFVDRAMASLLREKLRSSRYNKDEDISDIVGKFEESLKRKFDASEENCNIHFGRTTETDRAHGIWKGRLTLSRSEVSSTFDDVLARIVKSCRRLLHSRKVDYIIVSGGFGESPYLRKRLRTELSQDMKQLIVANQPSKKAAAEGAVIWYLKSFVVARGAKFTYGTTVAHLFDEGDSEHRARRSDRYIDAAGDARITNGFSALILKDTVVDEMYGQTSSYRRRYSEKPTDLGKYTDDILVWYGTGCPDWYKDSNGNMLSDMSRLCTLEADLSGLTPSLRMNIINLTVFWEIEFSIRIEFGGTKLRAMLEWKEGSTVRRGPASLLPNSISEL